MKTVRLHIELPDNWQAVGLADDESTELAAVRDPMYGERFTPNLTAVTHRVPVSVPVLTYADRVLGRMSQLAERISVFKNESERIGTGEPGTLGSVVVRGMRLVTLPDADTDEELLVQFQVHAGVVAPPGSSEYQVMQLVMSCASHQREQVEPEFQSIVDNFGVESAGG